MLTALKVTEIVREIERIPSNASSLWQKQFLLQALL